MEWIQLHEKKSLDQFSDTTFFSDIRFMCQDKYLYVSDYSRCQVMVVDNKDQLLETIGSKGKGPGEFLGPSAVFVKDDTLYVHDETKKELYLFYESKFIRNHKVSNSWQGDSHFAVNNHQLIYSDYSDPHTLVFMNMDNDSIVRFGKKTQFGSPTKNRIRNNRSVYATPTNIYAVSDNMPIIERYDLSGKFIDQYDYSDVNIVAKRISFIKRQPDEEKSYYTLISDSYLYNNRLFLLICTNNEEQVESNKILEINLDDQTKATRLYDLGEGWYQSLSVAETLWVFESKRSILINFEIP